MNDEEKKLRAAQLGISVADLEKGLADGSLSIAGSDQSQQGAPAANQITPNNQQAGTGSANTAAAGGTAATDNTSTGSSTPEIEFKDKNAANTAQVYSQYGDRIKQIAAATNKAEDEILSEYLTNADAANEKYNTALAGIRKDAQGKMNTSLQTFADIVSDYDKRYREAKQEAIAQRQAEQRAAIWTGAGEVAASLANLIAVGGYNAVNQQYKQYSQDWMRKAEENWRANRHRMDSIRERQNSIRMHLEQMRMGDIRDTRNFEAQMAANTLNQELGRAGVVKDSKSKANERNAAAEQGAAQAETTGKTSAISIQAQSENARRYGGGGGRSSSDGDFGITFSDGVELKIQNPDQFFNTVRSNKRHITDPADLEIVNELLNSKGNAYDRMSEMARTLEKYPAIKKALTQVAGRQQRVIDPLGGDAGWNGGGSMANAVFGS